MNATPKFLAATAEVDAAAVAPLPKSRKVYESVHALIFGYRFARSNKKIPRPLLVVKKIRH